MAPIPHCLQHMEIPPRKTPVTEGRSWMRAIGNRARAPAPWLLAVVQRARRFRHLLRFAHESVAPGGLLKTFPKQPAQTEVPCRISGLIDTQPADGEFRSQHRMPTSVFRYRTHHSPSFWTNHCLSFFDHGHRDQTTFLCVTKFAKATTAAVFSITKVSDTSPNRANGPHFTCVILTRLSA